MVTHTHTHTYTHTHIHTYTHDNYYNPRCAHAHRGLITIARTTPINKKLPIATVVNDNSCQWQQLPPITVAHGEHHRGGGGGGGQPGCT